MTSQYVVHLSWLVYFMYLCCEGWNHMLPDREWGWSDESVYHDHGRLGCKSILSLKGDSRSLIDPTKPYRSRGLGSQSLQSVLETAENHTKPKISKVYLHVQVSNDPAKAFYERHGFIEVKIHEENRSSWRLGAREDTLNTNHAGVHIII